MTRSNLMTHRLLPTLVGVAAASLLAACLPALAQTPAQRHNTLNFLSEFRQFAALHDLWVGNDYCSWPHVTCDATNGEVTLQLAGLGLNGQMPELDDNKVKGHEVMVVHIDMSHNPELSGEFEEDWEDLTRLRYLDLSFTTLSGELPDDWRKMRSLQTIKVANTYACKHLPEWRQTSLQYIDISNNPNMRGSLKNDWARLDHLQYADISGCNFCGCMPKDWRRKPILVEAATTANPILVQGDCNTANKCDSESKKCGRTPPPPDPSSTSEPGPAPVPSSSSSSRSGSSTPSTRDPASSDSSGTTSTQNPVAPSSSSATTPSSSGAPDPDPGPMDPREWRDTRRFMRKLAAQIPAFARAWFNGGSFSDSDDNDDDDDDWKGLCGWRGIRCVKDEEGRLDAIRIVASDDFAPLEVFGFLPELTDGPYDEGERERGERINGNKVRVQQLILQDHPFLRGRLPRTWGGLSQLRTLNLEGTSVMGTIPMEWVGMRALRVMGLAQTNVCGALPEWGSEASLNALATATHPSSPPAAARRTLSSEGLFPYLQYLNVGSNPFLTGPLPSHWSTLMVPQTVMLSNLTACGCVPETWRGVPELMAAVDQLRNADAVKNTTTCASLNACSRVKYPPHCDM